MPLKKTPRPALQESAERHRRSLFRRARTGADQATFGLILGPAKATGATSGHLQSSQWCQLFLWRLQCPRGPTVDASQVSKARDGRFGLPERDPATICQRQADLPRHGQSFDAQDTGDPSMVSTKPGLTCVYRHQRLMDEPHRMPLYGCTLLRHQKQRSRRPSRRRSAHAAIPAMAQSKHGQCQTGQSPKLNADSLTEH